MSPKFLAIGFFVFLSVTSASLALFVQVVEQSQRRFHGQFFFTTHCLHAVDDICSSGQTKNKEQPFSERL